MNLAGTEGYSGTPLYRKLGIKPGFTIWVIHPPEHYHDLLSGRPEDSHIVENADTAQVVHLFTAADQELKQRLPQLMKQIPSDGMIWVSWPKKASKLPSTVTEDRIREIALPLGLVDIKVCAVDAVWSGLKLVIRKELRK